MGTMTDSLMANESRNLAFPVALDPRSAILRAPVTQ
jgi:hypothetical protein